MKRAGSIVVVLALVALGVVFRGPLGRWFSGKDEPRPPPAAHVHAAQDAGAFSFSPSAREALQVALGGYEQLRDSLARDDVSRVGELGPVLAGTLHRVLELDSSLPPQLRGALDEAAAAAHQLNAKTTLAQARLLFGKVSRGLVEAALVDPTLTTGWALYECPMAEDYGRWLQPEGPMANPYMGTRMLKCGAEVPPSALAPTEADAEEVAWFTCPMHPGVRQATAGQCPICGMDLVAVTKGDLKSGVVTVDEVRRQKLGVKVAPVTEAPFTVTVRTVGEVKFDERTLTDVNLQVGGWIRGLKVDTTGQPVRKGQVLFLLYSPDLFSAQQEYLLALRAAGGDAKAPLPVAARQRLKLWGLDDAQLTGLEQGGAAAELVPIRSPASGVIIEKDVVEGGSVMAGQRLFRIGATDRVWIEAQVFEAELPFVTVGTPVEIKLPFMPAERFEGKVAYVYPSLQGTTRTGQLRIELQNRAGLLKPEMYADVIFHISRGVRVTVPTSAIIYTGPRRLVFVDLGNGRLRPREVKLGLRGDNGYEVLEGLRAGERVVTSGNFLIAAESRLRSATGYWGGEIDGEPHVH